MTDKINTNISPYFDDFDKTKNYNQVLFKSGYPIQARELNNLQSIAQNQIKSLSDVQYQNGDLISGGEITYDKDIDVVLLTDLFNGNPPDGEIQKLIGKTITGNTTNVNAIIIAYISKKNSSSSTPSLYIKYISSGNILQGIQYTKFADNEVLSYNNAKFAKTIATNSTIYNSSIVHINQGSFYWDGYYVNLNNTSVVLDQYTNTGNYSVGIQFTPKFITAADDNTLTDNASGFNNCAAVGADRLQILANVIKLSYGSPAPTNYTELLQVVNGNINYKIDVSINTQIIDAIAEQTYRQAGNYVVKDFDINVYPTLNNLFNNGVYTVNDKNEQNKTIINQDPLLSETDKINGNNYYSVELSTGDAVVKGYNYKYQDKQLITVELTNTTSKKINQQSFIDCGSYFEIIGIEGILDLTSSIKTINLYSNKNGTIPNIIIGTAKAVSIYYTQNAVRLYIIDLSTYTDLKVSGSLTNLVYGDYVTGTISGSSGYVYSVVGNIITLENITGSFIPNEPVINSKNNISNTILEIRDYLIDDIRSIGTIGFSATLSKTDFVLTGSNFIINGNNLTAINSKFTTELHVGSNIKLGSSNANVSSIVNNNALIIDGSYPLQNISTLYKSVSILKSNNKNLYIPLTDINIKDTPNKKISIVRNSLISFTNNVGIIPNQTSNENYSGEVLAMTSAGRYIANFTGVGTITLVNSENPFNGVGIVSYTVELQSPTTTTNTLVENKVIKYDKAKADLMPSEYGIRYDDPELSLGFTNVSNILAIRYSNNDNTNNNYTNDCFDSITISNNSLFNIGDIVYNKNIKAKIIQITGNILNLIYYSSNHFSIADIVNNWNTSANSVVTNTFAGNYIDVSNNYNLIKNNNSNIHDIDKLKIINTNNLPTNHIVVVFDYYNTNVGDITSVDSYTNSTSDVDNNIIDLRYYAKSPTIVGLGNLLSPYSLISSGLNASTRILKNKSFPAPNTIFKTDYNYYTPRTDLLIIDTVGKCRIISGISANNPNTPDLPQDCLAIATLEIPPLSKNTSDIKIVVYQNKRYTMQDIGNLEKRIQNTETEVSLNKLESTANNTILLNSNGIVRLKTGFVVDEFLNYKLSETTNLSYQSNINPDEQILIPKTDSKNIKLVPTGGNYKLNKNLISLPYIESTLLEQTNKNYILNVNPYALNNWEGILNSYPSSDNWFYGNFSDQQNWFPITSNKSNKKFKTSENYLKQQTINLILSALKPNTKLDVYINSKNITDLVIPSKCSIKKDGTNGTNTISFIVGESLLWKNINIRTLVGSKYQPTVVSNYKSAKVTSLSSGTYTGTTSTINVDWGTGYQFNVEDIGIGTYIIGETSGAVAILKNKDIISDNNGNFQGNIFIPNPAKSDYKFPIGNLVLSAIGNNTFAKTIFQCGGNTNIETKDIISLSTPENNDATIIQNQINGNIINNGWTSPITQSFNNNIAGGCFVTSLELFFNKKDNYIPVIIQLRTVANNYPTETIMPFSEVSIHPKDVTTSSDGSIPTIIKFNNVVYLKENTQYCICVISNSNNYEIFSNNFELKNTKDIVTTKNPNIANLYIPQNYKNWTADNKKSIKFKLNKAKFSLTGNINFNNVDNSISINNNYITTTKNSNLISIYCKNHGMHTTNNSVTIQNIVANYIPTILTDIIADTQYTTATAIIVETPELIPQFINNLPVSITNPGYIKIDDEIISYISVNNNTKLIVVPIGGRGINNTSIVQHPTNSVVQIYSINGVPLIELNKIFNSIVPIDLDNFGVYVVSNANYTNVCGGDNIAVSINHQYESITPNISYKYFPENNISLSLSGISGTSISSTNVLQPSFIPVNASISLDKTTNFNNPLLVASKENETIIGRKSMKLNIDMSTNNENISPIIDYDKCSAVVTTNMINNVAGNELLPNGSPSSFVYITKPISLILPSQAITIVLDAARNVSENIEVYLKLSREDNAPNFNNNNFVLVPVVLYPSGSDFKELRFELRNLPQYKEFQVKIVGKSSNQASYPRIKNLRIISTAN